MPWFQATVSASASLNVWAVWDAVQGADSTAVVAFVTDAIVAFAGRSALPVTRRPTSAIVKLAVAEPESAALRRYLRRRRPLVTSALAGTEVARALLPLGPAAVRRGLKALSRLELIRVSDRIPADAGALLPADLRSLDAIHRATLQHLGTSVVRVVIYDQRMSATAVTIGLPVHAPT